MLGLKKLAAKWSVRPGVTFFHDDISSNNLLSVNPLKPAQEIGTLLWLGALGCWRGGKQGDDLAAFANAHRLTLFHPI